MQNPSSFGTTLWPHSVRATCTLRMRSTFFCGHKSEATFISRPWAAARPSGTPACPQSAQRSPPGDGAGRQPPQTAPVARGRTRAPAAPPGADHQHSPGMNDIRVRADDPPVGRVQSRPAAALRQRRHPLHKAGNHSLCLPQNCPEAVCVTRDITSDSTSDKTRDPGRVGSGRKKNFPYPPQQQHQEDSMTGTITPLRTPAALHVLRQATAHPPACSQPDPPTGADAAAVACTTACSSTPSPAKPKKRPVHPPARPAAPVSHTYTPYQSNNSHLTDVIN